jgi:hypothetical protein
LSYDEYMATIRIEIEGLDLTAELYPVPAADILRENLPLDARLSRWGEEYYGSIPVDIPPSDQDKTVMEVGEIAYWVAGSAFCLFFGPTPASHDERPVAASDVVPLGRITGDLSVLKDLPGSVAARLSLRD